MKIKALSIYQPWASLIAVGAKRFETRSWATSYRGPLLICASKRIFNLCDFSPEFKDALFSLLPTNIMAILNIPFGKAVAIVDLIACVPTTDIMALWLDGRGPAEIGMELNFGDFSAGRYAWELANVRAIEPFPVKGRQGLFEVEVPEGLI
jgi:hypothetical protein